MAKKRGSFSRHAGLNTVKILYALTMTLFVLLPLLLLASQIFFDSDGAFVGFSRAGEFFTNPSLGQATMNSIYVSTIATVIAVVLGFLFAYALERTSIHGKKTLHAIALLPLFAPTMLHGIALKYLLGRQGLITTGLFGLLPALDVNLYGKVLIIAAEVLYCFPQVVMIMSLALSNTDFRLYESSRIMGASRAREFFRLTLPNITYSLVSCIIVCFSLSFADFGAPKVLGEGYNVLSIEVYKRVIGQQNFSLGAVASFVLMIPAVLSYVANTLVRRKQEGTLNASSTRFRLEKRPLRDGIAGAYCWIIALAILVLIATMFLAATVRQWPYDLSLTFDRFLMKNVPRADGMQTYFNSLLLALVSAGVGTIMVFVATYLIEKVRSMQRTGAYIRFLSMLPMSIPGLVVGIAFILFYNHPANPLNFIYGTMAIMVIANVVHMFSTPYLTATASLRKQDKEYEMVSDVMGVPRVRTFFCVTLPLSLRAFAENFIYYFVNAMATISALVFLYSPGFKPMSVAIINMEETGDVATAAAMSLMILVTNLVVRLVFDKRVERLDDRVRHVERKPRRRRRKQEEGQDVMAA
nr:putative 2-aminoethylphosphonate ABC transporter permease subunit [Maliibacterium massiliense]